MIAEETRDLLRRAQAGDAAAAEQMVTENTGLIWSVARRFFGRGVEPDDLYQLGCVGFLKAMQGFDEQYGTCFSTYAVPKISGEIRRFLRDDGAVKVCDKVRGEKALAAGICKKVAARVQQPEKQTGILLYGDVPEERLAEVEKRMREEIGFKDVVRCAIGPSVLSNTGPLAIAVAYYGAPRE